MKKMAQIAARHFWKYWQNKKNTLHMMCLVWSGTVTVSLNKHLFLLLYRTLKITSLKWSIYKNSPFSKLAFAPLLRRRYISSTFATLAAYMRGVHPNLRLDSTFMPVTFIYTFNKTQIYNIYSIIEFYTRKLIRQRYYRWGHPLSTYGSARSLFKHNYYSVSPMMLSIKCNPLPTPPPGFLFL